MREVAGTQQAEGPKSDTGLGLGIPVGLAAVTVLVAAPVLSAIAGPHILPTARAARFAGGIWVSHALLFVCMGYAAGSAARVRGLVLGAVVAALAGVAAGLFYTQAGLMPAGLTSIGGLAICGLVGGLIGGAIGMALPGTGAWAAIVWVVLGLGMLCGAFLQAGVVAGKVTRTVDVVVEGMTTAQKEMPVGGIRVVLCTPDGKTRLYEARTNNDGGYCFNGPRPGTYTVWALDDEATRGSGRWVSQTVKAHGHLTGQGLYAGNVALPAYRDVQVNPFIGEGDSSGSTASSAPAGGRPGGAGQTGEGTQGQMQRLLNDAMGGGH